MTPLLPVLKHNLNLVLTMLRRSFPVLWLLPCLICAIHSAGITATLHPDNPWPLHIIDSTSEGADGVRLGDINHDGLPDITTGWEEGGLVRVYIHPGYANSTRPWPAVTVGTVADVEDAVFADVNGDGALEVVSSCEGGQRAMYVHSLIAGNENLLDPGAWRTQRLEAASETIQWMFCTPAVLTPEGTQCLVAGGKNENASLGYFARPNSQQQWRWNPLAKLGWVMSIRVPDMDGDGDRDILFTDRKGPSRGVRWLENPADSGADWKEHLVGGRDCELMFLDMADLDGDGQMELAVAAKDRKILIFDPLPGGQWQRFEIPFPEHTGNAKAVALADFDLDGQLDLVVSCEGAVDCSGVFWIRTSGWPNPGAVEYFDISGPRGIKFDRIECVDIDGDGDPDVLTTDERDNLGVIWYENPLQ